MELTPRALFGLARSTVDTAVSLPGRVLGLLTSAEAVVRGAEELLARTRAVLDETEALLARANAVTAKAEVVTTTAQDLTTTATAITTDAGSAARTARELLESYAPLAKQAQPLAKRFVDDLTPQEIDAAIELVDQLPVLTKHLLEDVLPMLATLDRVGPDIHQLMEIADDVRQAVLGIPGFTFLRKRGEDREEREEKG